MSGRPGRWLVLCETAAVPRRNVLFIETLSSRVTVDVLCWSRLGTAQVPEELAGKVSLSRGRSLAAFLLEIRDRLAGGTYDGVLVSDLRLLAAALFWSSSSRARVVYDRMEIPTVALAQRVRSLLPVSAALLERWAETVESWLVGKAWGVFSVPLEGDARRHVERLHPRLRYVANWPSRRELAPPSGTVAAGSRARPFTVIHAGAVGPSSGLSAVLDAAEIVGRGGAEVRWVLVGYPVGITSTQVRDAIAARGLEASVTLVDRVPFARLPGMLEDADAGLALLDPDDEKFRYVGAGMSRKVFTYMAAGLPVITNRPHGQWVGDEGLGVVVTYGDGAGLADAVRALRDDPERRAALGAAGRSAVAARYHWERQSEAILDLMLEGRG